MSTPEGEDKLAQTAEAAEEAIKRDGLLNIIEGVDFMWDYYEILKIPRDADIATIRKALRTMKGANHEDKMEGIDEEHAETARKKWAFVEKMEKVLLDPEKKVAFDKNLAEFDARLVSKDWKVSINPILRRRVAVEYLLSDGGTEDLLQVAEDMPESGHDEEELAEIRAQYEADPENTFLKKTYRKALGRKLDHMDNQEMGIWIEAGVMDLLGAHRRNLAAQDVDYYAEDVEAEIERLVAKEIPQVVDFKMKALTSGIGGNPLLLTDGSGEAQEVDLVTAGKTAVLAQLREKATSAFSEKADAIRRVALEKQEVLRELLKVSDYEYIKRSDEPTKTCVVATVIQGLVWLAVEAEGTNIVPTDFEGTEDELKAANPDKDLIIIQHNNKLPSRTMEVIYMVDNVLNADDEE